MDSSRTAPPILIRSRLLQMMSALERSGGTPIDTQTLHAFAFFTNVLSPLWDLDPLDGSVLKEKEGPRYPALQNEIDTLIMEGFIIIESFELDKNKEGNQRLKARFRLDTKKAEVVLRSISSLPDEVETEKFLLELASAFIEIRPEHRKDAALLDAAYSDPSVSGGRIVDFAEWVKPTIDNPAWNTAQSFQHYLPEGMMLNRAEKVVMYMRLMKQRANG